MVIGSYSVDHGLGEIVMQDVRENFADMDNIIDEKHGYIYTIVPILNILHILGYLSLAAGGIVFVIQIWKKKNKPKKPKKS